MTVQKSRRMSKRTEKTGELPRMEIKRILISRINPAPYNPRKDLQPGDPEYESLKGLMTNG